MKLPKLFNLEAMTDEQLLELFYIGQQMADLEDRRGDTKACLEYSELWCAADDLLKTRGVWA